MWSISLRVLDPWEALSGNLTIIEMSEEKEERVGFLTKIRKLFQNKK